MTRTDRQQALLTLLGENLRQPARINDCPPRSGSSTDACWRANEAALRRATMRVATATRLRHSIFMPVRVRA